MTVLVRWQSRLDWRSILLLSVSSGGAAAASFTPVALYPLSFVAFAPLFWTAIGTRPSKALTAGMIAGVVLYGVGFRAILPAIMELQHWPAPRATLVFAAFVSYHALRWGLFAAGAAWLLGEDGRNRRTEIGPATAVAALWVTLEWATPQIVPWVLGSSLGPSRLLRQSAAVAGAYGLSFMIILVNVLITLSFWRARYHAAGAARPAIVAATILALATLYGAIGIQPDDYMTKRVFAVTIVQGGVDESGTDLTAINEAAWSRYEALTIDASGRSELFVWPETVLRVYLRQNPFHQRRLIELAGHAKAPIMLGALDQPGIETGELNAAYLVTAKRHEGAYATDPLLQHSYKSILVPFAERVPFAAAYARTAGWRTTADLAPGGRSILYVQRPGDDAIGLAPSICYEAIMPGSFNDLVRQGGNVLVNLTDDSWFDEYPAPDQHLEMARLRAVETRRWLVRASGSGISAFIDPNGEIVSLMAVGQSGTLTHYVTPSATLTPYVRFGDWVVGLSAVVLIVELARRSWARVTVAR